MQEKKKDNNSAWNMLTLKTYLGKLRKFFKIWLIATIIIAVLNVGINLGLNLFNGTVQTTVNFSFDGIESGIDPNGNKFDVNDIKSKEIVQESIDELGLGLNAEDIINYISIDGIVPEDVIERITHYNSILSSGSSDSTIDTYRNIQDTSYYPTQYKISLECHEVGLGQKDSAALLNKITEKYYTEFYNKYGYNESLGAAVKSIDYKDYDYVDAIEVFNASLGSLKNYINELASSDQTRFRAENGYTFADISASIDTIRNEDLDWISSYIFLNNVTKDKKTLIENYKFRIEELKREKTIAEETIDSVTESIEVYEKNAILIFNNATEGVNAEIYESSDTYDSLISKKLSAQSSYSSCEEKIKLYESRIKSLESGNSDQSDIEAVELQLDNVSAKIDTLLETASETSKEYYEENYLNNAYTVLEPASSSVISIVVSSVKDSMRNIMVFELFLTALYFTVSAIDGFRKTPEGSGAKSKKSKKK